MLDGVDNGVGNVHGLKDEVVMGEVIPHVQCEYVDENIKWEKKNKSIE